MGLHPAYAHLGSHHPVGDAALLRRLGKVCSALAHWAPVLAESAFLPALAFPFVRLFRADLESCFEVSTCITHWCIRIKHAVHPALCTDHVLAAGSARTGRIGGGRVHRGPVFASNMHY